jgi:LPS export ABC transporter protein LptC
MKQVNLVWSILLLIFLFLLSGSGIKSREESVTSSQSRKVVLPDYILKGVRHYHYEEGVLRMEASFEEGEYYASSQELYIDNCNFLYYDKNGTVVSRGSSDKARLYGNRSLIIAENNVSIVSEVNGTLLETDYLEWHGEEERFVTESNVVITRKNGDRLSGRGMVADLALRLITIKSDVKGSFRSNQP